MSADDYDAELAERYGWINRAVPAGDLNDFVQTLARRIGRSPTDGRAAIKDRVNALTLARESDFRRDSDLFGEQVRTPQAQQLIGRALSCGLQTRSGELEFASLLRNVAEAGAND